MLAFGKGWRAHLLPLPEASPRALEATLDDLADWLTRSGAADAGAGAVGVAVMGTARPPPCPLERTSAVPVAPAQLQLYTAQVSPRPSFTPKLKPHPRCKGLE